MKIIAVCTVSRVSNLSEMFRDGLNCRPRNHLTPLPEFASGLQAGVDSRPVRPTNAGLCVCHTELNEELARNFFRTSSEVFLYSRH